MTLVWPLLSSHQFFPGGGYDDVNGTVIRLAVRAFLGGSSAVHDAH